MPPRKPKRAAPSPRAIAAALSAWGAERGRTFDWRSWRDPYRLIVTEILLRQTRAESVAEFAPSFLHTYPNPASLQAETETQLEARLRPLGFGTQRARQLKAFAAAVEEAGTVPVELAHLLALPGVGRYTAAMVAATAVGTRVAAVDTNVARVICRVFGITPSHAEARKSRNVWDLATAMVDAAPDAASLTWAVIDLAATICLQRTPRCPECPLREECLYARSRVSPTETNDVGAPLKPNHAH